MAHIYLFIYQMGRSFFHAFKFGAHLAFIIGLGELWTVLMHRNRWQHTRRGMKYHLQWARKTQTQFIC